MAYQPSSNALFLPKRIQDIHRSGGGIEFMLPGGEDIESRLTVIGSTFNLKLSARWRTGAPQLPAIDFAMTGRQTFSIQIHRPAAHAASSGFRRDLICCMTARQRPLFCLYVHHTELA